MPERLRVAIIGGGLMGTTLANGLLRFEHIDWHVFEAKPQFVERGATVGFRDNGIKALIALGLDYQDMFQKSGAAISDVSHMMAAYGEFKGQTLSKLPAGHVNLMRTRWLEQLLAPLPTEKLHANKKLANVDVATAETGPYTLRFQDGSSFEADAVIGCDGIRSSIRKIVLEQYPDLVSPRFGGYWDARGLTTPQKAAESFGNDLFDPLKPSEIALTGGGAFMLFCPSENGQEYAVIISAAARPDFDTDTWKTTLDRAFLKNAFEQWDPSFADAVIDCIMADGSNMIFSQWMSPETPTYCRGPGVCIAGDAAHSMLPFMGNGSALAMEDAAVISALLGACNSAKDVWPALQAYDWAQRERGEDMVKQSQSAAKLMTGQYGLDPNGFKELDPNKWWVDIINTDVEGNIGKAVEYFHQLRQDGN